VLKKQFPQTAHFNMLIRKSPSSPEEYEVLAMVSSVESWSTV
jgi:hypothetical protein